MFKDEKVRNCLEKELNKLYKFDWYSRFNFIDKKYNDIVQFYYLLTYTLRHKYSRSTEDVYEEVFQMIFKHSIIPGSEVYLLHIDDISALGNFMSIHINQYFKAIIEICSAMCISVKIIKSVKECPKDNLLINIYTILESAPSEGINPFKYSTAENKFQAEAYNILLNLFNCCYSDTITDIDNPYKPIKFIIKV